MKTMRIESEEGLAELLAGAGAPLRIMGGGTRGLGAPVGDVLEVGISGVRLHEPGALTLVAAAGTPVEEIEAVLAAEGQRLAFEVPDMRGLMGREGRSTIGGVVAANASGPRRVQAGACRDYLLGVRFVDGMGRIVSNGGRVMKNVTGYDLVKLMAGSHGCLGVLTEVSFKVLPVPERVVTLACAGLDPAAAVAALSAGLGSPFDVTGAAWHGGVGYLRLEGFAASVAYRAGRLQAALPGDWDALDGSGSGSGPGSASEVWQAIRDVAAFHGVAGDVWRVSVAPSQAPALIARAEAREVVMDWGGGLLWLLVDRGVDLRARLGEFGGHATLVRGEGAAVFHPEPAPVAALSAGIRARFDPKGILNRGLMA